MAFKQIDPYALQENVFQLFNHDWTLVTAGDKNKCNTMTASWGGFGIMWHKPVATIVLRPERYTLEFVEQQDYWSLSFFADETHRKALGLLGSKSGRDGDKMLESGLHTTMLDGVPIIEEARLVLICKKLYQQDMQPDGFVDATLDEKHYSEKNYHRIFVGEIEKAYLAE